MNPWMFGAVTASALIVPFYGHAEGIALWLLGLIEKIDRWAETSTKIEKEKDTP